MKLLFFGSPQVAVPFLEECARAPGHAVAGVVTQPDRPSGRGLKLSPSAVKEAALRLGLMVFQPQRPSEIAQELRDLGADLAVVVAYGRLLKPDVLSAPRLGCMNVHFSLLPKYRGAAPIQWALINGEERTGVSLFWLDEGMDTGPLQSQAALDIAAQDDAVTLAARLVELGLSELRRALGEAAAGRIRRDGQRGDPSLAPKLGPELARLPLDRSARELHDRVRGLRAGPRAYFPLRLPGREGETRLGILRTRLESESEAGERPGHILRVERGGGILVQCHPGRLWILEVQPEGKKQLQAADFVNGLRIGPGDRLEVL